MSSQTVFITKATTNVTVYVDLVQDNSGTNPGDPLTGLVYNSASLTCYYVRPLAAAAALSLATQTVTGAHSDGGFVEVDATNMPGKYRLDLSDAICATGVNSAEVTLAGYADLSPHTIHIVLMNLDIYDGVRAGLTALPNAAPDAIGGLVISDAGGLDIDTMNSNVSAILTDTGTTLPATLAGLNDLSAADVNAEVLDVLNTDTHAELAGVPAATSTMFDKLNWVFMQARNKFTQTATTSTLRNDADSGDVATSTVSDDGTTFTRGEWT